MRKWRAGVRRVALPLCAAAALLAGACQAPEGGPRAGNADRGPVEVDPTRVPAQDDIVRIHQFYTNYPWLVDSDNRVVGFQVPAYFISAASQSGVFVSGRILVWLYVVERGADNRLDKKLAYGWEMEPADALGYRIRKRAVMGYYYGFPLKWPATLDLTGREIEIVFGYERLDGKLIEGAPRRFKVPVPAWYKPESAEASPTRAPGPRRLPPAAPQSGLTAEETPLTAPSRSAAPRGRTP